MFVGHCCKGRLEDRRKRVSERLNRPANGAQEAKRHVNMQVLELSELSAPEPGIKSGQGQKLSLVEPKVVDLLNNP